VLPILRRIAGPGIIFGGWQEMTSHFTIGAVIVCVGALVSLLEVISDEFFNKKCHYALQVILVGAIFGLFDLFLIFIVMDAAPLVVYATSTVPKYGQFSAPYGIEWRSEYSQLNFTLKNSSDKDYENFDAEISTDLVFEKIKQIRGLEDCKIEGTHPTGDVTNQLMAGGVPVGPVEVNPGEYKVVPADKDGRIIGPELGGADTKYRIRCDRLPAKSNADFFAALEAVNIGRMSGPIFSPPRAAGWISVEAKFQTSGRVRAKTISKCAMQKLCREN
jgi:hypothetical protein